MKFTMDEAMKHRLVGIAVIVSIALVFLPAMIKKNNQRLEEKRIVVELPVKPPQPQVATVDKTKVFEQTHVAHVNLDTQKVLHEADDHVKQHPIAKPTSIKMVSSLSYPIGSAKPLSVGPEQPIKPSPSTNLNVAKRPVKAKTQHLEVAQVKKHRAIHQAKLSPATKPFSVQIGVFSDNKNALSLKQKLSSQGYQSRLVKTNVHGKKAVKVLVGSLASMEEARVLKIKLAKQAHLQGFVTKEVG